MSFWCGQQLVVTLDGPSGRSEYSVAQPFARVGSHPDADVVIDDESVAPRCVYLHATEEGVFCLYLDVDADALAGKGTWLAPEDEVPLGDHRLRARLAGTPVSNAAPTINLASRGSAPPPVPLVMIYCGKRLKDKRRFRARLSAIGRRPQCALQLKGEKVSGFHCVLFWDGEQLWCVDLVSSNGTQLNGAPLVCQRVNIGDRLDVGEFGLVLLRLSHRPPVQSPADTESQPGADALDPPHSHAGEASQPADSPDESTIVATPADELAAAASSPQAPQGQAARDLASELQLQRAVREQLAEEVARLAREREDMHRQWEQSSQQLRSQVDQLHAEAAALASERQAFEQSRQAWQAERDALAQQLVERSDQLARSQADLAAATGKLADQLANAERQAIADPPRGPTADDWRVERAHLTEQLRERSAQLARMEADLATAKASPDRLARLRMIGQDSALSAAPAVLEEPTPGRSTALPPAAAADPSSSTRTDAPLREPRPAALDRDRHPLSVGDRIIELSARRDSKWLWWSAGSVGVVAAIAAVVAILEWVF
jgi:pSer/pThr/pTyr-binding forkhead associated (FHA) protein